MDENTTISIRIPASLRDLIQQRADANYRSFSAEVRMLIEAQLEVPAVATAQTKDEK